MLEYLAQEVLRRRHEFASKFRSASPFPHLIIDRFFDPAFCEELVRTFPAFDRGCNTNENGLPGRKSTVEDLRSLGGAYVRADDLFRSSDFASFISDATGIQDLLYDPAYIGGGTHENLPGQDLDPHVDFNYHPHQGWHRRLNLIVYLNDDWQEEWGGSLELHQDPWLPPEQNQISRVLPLANRAIVFETSERSWHGFEAIRPPPRRTELSRKSLAIYMYTRDRPASETAPPHSTVYVERPLPFVLRPGQAISYEQYARVNRMLVRRMQHVERLEKCEREFTERLIALVAARLTNGEPLDDAEVELLGTIFRREDALLRTLYDREKEFTRDLGVLERAIGGERGNGLPVLGSLRLLDTPVGYHPKDKWAAPVLDIDLMATRAGKEFTVHGHIPDVIGGGQVLRCAVGGNEHSVSLTPGTFKWAVPVSVAGAERLRVTLRASNSIRPARDVPGATDPRDLAYQLWAIELA